MDDIEKFEDEGVGFEEFLEIGDYEEKAEIEEVEESEEDGEDNASGSVFKYSFIEDDESVKVEADVYFKEKREFVVSGDDRAEEDMDDVFEKGEVE